MGSSATTRIGTGSLERADHQPELFAALDHAEQRLSSAGADPDGLEPPAQDEAHRGEHDVRLVDDAPGRILRDPSEPHDFLEGLIGRTLKVLVHFQERNDAHRSWRRLSSSRRI